MEDKLETLLVVADTKNFTKAAKILNLTQPAVSNHIIQLEKQYNCKLFVRNKKELKLTEQGELAVKYARRIKALNEKLSSELLNFKANYHRLRIGITHTAESNNITEVLAKYSKLHHNISITIITDTIKNLYDMLKNYEIDVAIVEDKPNEAKLNHLILDTDYLVCVLNKNNPLSNKSTISLSDMKKENMILRLPTSATRQLFEAALYSNNDSIENFNVGLEVDNISTIKDLIKKGMGISVLPMSACIYDANKEKISILPIENLTMVREMNIVYNQDFENVDMLKEFVKLYQSIIKN